MMALDLSGTWTLTRIKDGSTRNMTVPGDIVSALVASGEVADPYLGRNELDAQWVGREDWKLSRCFELSAGQAGASTVALEIDVLDCFAAVFINGLPVGTSRNMFVPAYIPIRTAARQGQNTIEIALGSPESAAMAASASLPYPSPASTYPISAAHRNLIRKVQCMAGWDWGPCLMTSGIYDGIRVVVEEGPRITGASASMLDLGAGTWSVTCSVELHSSEAGKVRLEASLAGTRAATVVDAPAGRSRQVVVLEVHDPELWWPVGHGGQALYELQLGARIESAPASRSCSISKTVGFRTVRVRCEADADGRSMAVEFNGRPVFLKGANWIPQDALPSRWNEAGMRKLLDAALDANMNTLRVWGGGRYETDAFYEYCDRRGIVLWQDFMFSCATYPSASGFLENVEEEARAQILRLGHHPSIALWCGNNEDLGAINWFEESKANPYRYLVDYDRLNEGVIGHLVRELDPGRPWWPSSPSAGPGDYSDNWHSDNAGDMHYWSVWHEGKPFSAYLEVRPRFCSEFGFQSLPSVSTVASFAEPADRNVTSPVMEHHQRHPRGNELILTTMLRYFRMPRGFEETLYLSQVQQAMAIRTAVDFWRSTLPRCMGSLYWQLNDVWPCASWSSLEYGGRWKLLHYEARRFYSAFAPYIFVKDGALYAGSVNDGPTARSGTLRFRTFDFSGHLLEERMATAELDSLSAEAAWELPLSALPAGPSSCFCVVDLTENDTEQGQAYQSARAWCFPTEPKRCEPEDPGIVAVPATGPGGGPAIALSCSKPAFWVAPELFQNGQGGTPASGQFSDAGFLLLPGETRILGYMPAEGEAIPSAAELAGSTHAMHLYASYR